MVFIFDVLADVSFLYGACIVYRKYLLLSDDHETVVIMGILINQKNPLTSKRLIFIPNQ